MKGHWSCTCRTTKHLVDLYQASMKEKTNTLKQILLTEKTMNPDDLFFDDDGAVPLKHFDVSDFF